MLTEFERILRDVFSCAVTRPELTVDEERQLISDAQYGDDEATLTLILTYGDLLRSQVRRHEARLSAEEARSVAVSGLLEAIHGFDLQRLSGRLVEIAPNYVARALGDTPDPGDPVTVPPRTRRRYFAVLLKAGGDHEIAELLAPENGMTVEVFRAVRAAVAHAYSLTEPPPRNPGPSAQLTADPNDLYASVEDRYLADTALDAIDGHEYTVTRYAYGFATGEGLSDGEVAETWSLDELGRDAVGAGQYVASRAKVQRLRSSALGHMRSALGVA